MKKKKVITGLIVSLFIINLVIFTFSCKQKKTCLLLKGITFLPFKISTYDTIKSMDSVLATDFSLRINYNTIELNCFNNINPSCLVTTSMAYKPYISTLNYDTIKKITITSNQNFDVSHPAGVSLNSYFDVPDTINYTINEMYQSIFTLNMLPDSNLFHQFKIVVEISGTAPYDTILPPIKILK